MLFLHTNQWMASQRDLQDTRWRRRTIQRDLRDTRWTPGTGGSLECSRVLLLAYKGVSFLSCPLGVQSVPFGAYSHAHVYFHVPTEIFYNSRDKTLVCPLYMLKGR